MFTISFIVYAHIKVKPEITLVSGCLSAHCTSSAHTDIFVIYSFIAKNLPFLAINF